MAITDQILKIGNGGYSNILNSVNNIAGGVGSIIKKVKSFKLKELSVDSIRDLNTNGFLAQDSMFRPKFFARAFDEPTYLSFRIEFLFKDPDSFIRNTAYNNQSLNDKAIMTAMYGQMYDYMPEPFLTDLNGIGEKGKNDVSVGILYSTEHYLDWNLGDHGRAMILHNFKRALLDIQENFPFYFTRINGLDTLTTIEPNKGIRVEKGEITLECMEGLDLKITQLLQMYRKVVWDDVYQRWVLPDMMRYFGMRIYVSEMRLFSDIKNERGSVNTWDLNNAAYLNMTYNGQVYDKGGNFIDKAKNTASLLTRGSALSQAFLGTKSIITKALNYTSGTINTAINVYDSISGALDQLEYCNNAINEIMPTLCFECHMCEFDIQNTLSHISELSSSHSDSASPKPKIKIKVGQVKEKQSYPLNSTLRTNDKGYVKTIYDHLRLDSGIETTLNSLTNWGNLFSERDEHIGYLGNYIDDTMLNKRYREVLLGKRINEHLNNMKLTVGDAPAGTVNTKRLPELIINKSEKMNYTPGSSSQNAAAAGLFATTMNEAVSMATHLGISDNIIGTKSMATNPQSEQVSAMKSIGEMMNAAVERIYNGPEMKSMAAQGVPDEKRAAFANNSFNEFINQLEKSTATSEDYYMREFLKNYHVLQNE